MTQTASDNIDRNVLIVDRDPAMVRTLLEMLAARGLRGTVAGDRDTAAGHLDRGTWDLVFVDFDIIADTKTNDCSGFIRKIKAQSPELPIIMLSGSDSAQKALAAMRTGCDEFIVKPVAGKLLENLLETFVPNHETSVLAAGDHSNGPSYRIIGSSDSLKRTIQLARKVAPTSAPVLITGESGTGKELIAQLVHDYSRRAAGPFIKVNCAALNDSLLESELFGHEKGAFTGACDRHKGRFERAHGGTLLLDEITETQPAFQAKLLRVLEEMNFERVGGTENVNVNVRIVSTTNADILQKVHDGNFRPDLYYRLCGIKLIVEPLRERTPDIAELTWFFVNQFAHEAKRRITSLDPVMLDIFEKYHWPGNIRQLRNVVRTALILGCGRVLSLADVSWLIDELQPRCRTQCDLPANLVGTTLRQIEQQAILATLDHTDGNRTKAARVLGISDRTLRDKVKKYRTEDRLQPIG